MNKEKELLNRIVKLKNKMLDIGEMHPGSITEQYNVCGTVGCRCKDKNDPIKHGPYLHLSFTFKGKSGTKAIKKESLREFRLLTSNYRTFRKYGEELVQLNIDLVKLRGAK